MTLSYLKDYLGNTIEYNAFLHKKPAASALLRGL